MTCQQPQPAEALGIEVSPHRRQTVVALAGADGTVAVAGSRELAGGAPRRVTEVDTSAACEPSVRPVQTDPR